MDCLHQSSQWHDFIFRKTNKVSLCLLERSAVTIPESTLLRHLFWMNDDHNALQSAESQSMLTSQGRGVSFPKHARSNGHQGRRWSQIEGFSCGRTRWTKESSGRLSKSGVFRWDEP